MITDNHPSELSEHPQQSMVSIDINKDREPRGTIVLDDQSSHSQASGMPWRLLIIAAVIGFVCGVAVTWLCMRGDSTPDDDSADDSSEQDAVRAPIVGAGGKPMPASKPKAISYKKVLKRLRSKKKLKGKVSPDYLALVKDQAFIENAAESLYNKFTGNGQNPVGLDNLEVVSPLYEIMLDKKLKHLWIPKMAARSKFKAGVGSVLKYDDNHQLTKNKMRVYLRGAILTVSKPSTPSDAESADGSKVSKYYFRELEAGRPFDYNIVKADQIPKK